MTFRTKAILIIAFLLILVFILIEANSGTKSRFPTTNSATETGLRLTDCLFETAQDWPSVECYFMQVAENRSSSKARIIKFPVIVFRSDTENGGASPVLHLGAGGPGASMYLHDTWSVEHFWKTHYSLSLAQGRDLIVIDPRGAGLSRPLLTCNQFVDNELLRFQENLSLQAEIKLVDKDYIACINQLLSDGIDFASYNSVAIANDVEALRVAAGIDRWHLIGVSYGGSYAQAIARLFPDSVESMVLDSTVIPEIGRHENYIELTLGPYLKLYQYCDYDPKCKHPISDVENRFWELHSKLNNQPLAIEFEHTVGEEKIPITLNGERFLAAIFQGIYSVEIFEDLPFIITELETGEYDRLKPYLWLLIDYMLDRTYGDVSAIAHYCYEEKPFIDFKEIESQIEELPSGYIQKTARLASDWTDYCDHLYLRKTVAAPLSSEPIAIPTLFLHGRFDTVTPLSSVVSGQHKFLNNQLVTFSQAHSILTSNQCAHSVSAQFIADPNTSEDLSNCD